MQREAMAELLADLLLDHDLIDAQVELLLPLSGVHWRVLDGIEPGQFEQANPALADLPWPLQPQESYTASPPWVPQGSSFHNRTEQRHSEPQPEVQRHGLDPCDEPL